MMISESTYRGCETDVDVRELDTIRVVGKSEPVKVYESLERKNQPTAAVADLVYEFEKALSLYKNAEFAQAKAGFESCLSIFNEDGPSLTYINRCQTYVETPPDADWDGVFELTEKG